MKITEMKGASLLPVRIPMEDGATSCKKKCVDIGVNKAVTQLEQCSVEVDCEELVKKLKMIRIGGTLKDDNDKLIHLVLGDCYGDAELLKLAQELSKCKQNWIRLEVGR